MHLIYLIHGTWPNGPFRRVRPDEKNNWFHPNAPLSQALVQQLGNTVRVSAFLWSGENSVAQRTIAAEALAVRIVQDYQEQSPDGVFLLAHSHGGTVAVEMLCRHHRVLAAENVRLNGIICMASPFVFVSEATDVQREDSLDLAQNVVSLGLFGAILLLAPNLLQLPWYILLIGGVVAEWAVYAMLGVASQLLTPEAFTPRECLPATPSTSPSIDLIRAPADEASGLIGFVSFFKWMLGKLYLASHRTPTNWKETREYSHPARLVLRLSLGLPTTILSVVLLLFLSDFVRSLPTLNIVAIAVLLDSSVLALATLLAYTIFALACGLKSARRWGLVNLNMEPSPPNMRATMHLLPVEPEVRGLVHALHSWESVHKEVIAILKERIPPHWRDKPADQVDKPGADC